ncbi:MAG: hypothetical protein ACRDJM_08985, partial [Actinomycetota bacterium]
MPAFSLKFGPFRADPDHMDAFELLQHTVSTGASDLHFRVGLPPMVRLHGELLAVGEIPLGAEDTQKMVDQVCS